MNFFDEMLEDGLPRESYARYFEWYQNQDSQFLKRKMIEAEAVSYTHLTLPTIYSV